MAKLVARLLVTAGSLGSNRIVPQKSQKGGIGKEASTLHSSQPKNYIYKKVVYTFIDSVVSLTTMSHNSRVNTTPPNETSKTPMSYIGNLNENLE